MFLPCVSWGVGGHAKVMSQKPAGKIRGLAVDGLAVVFLGWLFYMGVEGLWRVLHTGTIKNRRGPHIDVSENPLVFWALSGFFGAGILIVGGLAVICLWSAFSNVTRKSNPDTVSRHRR